MKLALFANSLLIFCLGLTLSFSGCGSSINNPPAGETTAATPTFTPPSGTFVTSVDVSLSCADSGATIYYTIDGTDPSDTNGTQFIGTIHLTATTVVKAIAYVDGKLSSSIAWGTYTQSTVPIIDGNKFSITPLHSGQGAISYNPAGGKYENGTSVQITAIPELGWIFDHWEGDVTGKTNPVTIIMNSNKNVKAVFAQNSPVSITILNPTVMTNPSPVQNEPYQITVSCTVVDIGGTVGLVMVDLSQVGGSGAQVMTQGNNNIWSWTGTLSPSTSGLKKITFTAADIGGLTTKGITYVTVDSPNAPPVISNLLITGAFYEAQETATTLSCIVTDTDGAVKSVVADLSQIGGPNNQVLSLKEGTINEWTWSGKLTPPAQGNKQVMITATDNENATNIVTLPVLVGPPNDPPVVTDPQVTGVLIQNKPCDIAISCTATDTDGTVVSVFADLTAFGGSSTQLLIKGSNNQWTWSGTVSPILSGNQMVLFTAVDDRGGTGQNSVLTIIGGITVMAPGIDITSNFNAVNVSWNLIGLDLTNRTMRIQALQDLDPVTHKAKMTVPVSADFTPVLGNGSQIVDMSKLNPGSYTIRVSVLELDGDGNEVVVVSGNSSGKVILPNVYNGVYELTDLTAYVNPHYSPIDGCVFTGFNINDQAGFEVSGVGDVNGDGKDDFILFTRYGQEYTVGPSGSGYLINGAPMSDFQMPLPPGSETAPNIIPLNGIPPRGSGGLQSPLHGTLMLFPMENMAAVENGQIKGTFFARALPDISTDGKGDIILGCPEAGPLTIIYENPTPGDVTFFDHYGQEVILHPGTWAQPSHVEPIILIDQNTSNPPPLYFQTDFSVGDTIWYIVPGSKIVNLYNVYSTGYRRGASYMISSQEINKYRDGIYDLAKVGSPSEEEEPMMGATKGQMTTWWPTDERFAADICPIADTDGDGIPELLTTVSHAGIFDYADPNQTYRSNAGVVKMWDLEAKSTDLLSYTGGARGRISWWDTVFLHGNHHSSEGQDIEVDILGAARDSEVSSAGGLGRFVKNNGQVQYVTGDFNGDGPTDMVVGAPGEDGGKGSAYVIFGRTLFGRKLAQIDLNDFNQGIPPGSDPNLQVPILGIKIKGTATNERLGEKVLPAGDFNGDGYADVMFLEPNYTSSGKPECGRVVIFFGTGKPELIDTFNIDDITSSLGTQLPGIVLEGENAGDHFGQRGTTVYDVNGDGTDDILISAPDASDVSKTGCGKAYLIYGKKDIIKKDKATNFTYVDFDGDDSKNDTVFSVQRIGQPVWTKDTPKADGIPGSIFIGEQAGDHLQAVASAGDINADGVNDFLLGAPFANVSKIQQGAGKAYLIFGRIPAPTPTPTPTPAPGIQ